MSLATGLLKQAYINIFKDEISQIPLIVKKMYVTILEDK